MTHNFSVLSITEFYGPETRVTLVEDFDDVNAAVKFASEYRPDFDAKVNAHRLSHNQSSPIYGVAAQYIRSVAIEEDEDMDALLKSHGAEYAVMDDFGTVDLYAKIDITD